jgi:hypothetical protein
VCKRLPLASPAPYSHPHFYPFSFTFSHILLPSFPPPLSPSQLLMSEEVSPPGLCKERVFRCKAPCPTPPYSHHTHPYFYPFSFTFHLLLHPPLSLSSQLLMSEEVLPPGLSKERVCRVCKVPLVPPDPSRKYRTIKCNRCSEVTAVGPPPLGI